MVDGSNRLGRCAPSYGWLRRRKTMTTEFYYVYLIRSTKLPAQTYIGFTEDLQQRIADQNGGASVHTAPFRPWRLVSAHAFMDVKRAREFEKYLKSGSGRASANLHLW
jgi:putative endonuclease